ncbi:Na+/H+ antiporter NhaA [Sphaerisporangium dianthi]|uniref:Na(+)/H(+) antiporter NhaA n=1 Tax=Sphaerisporangium dianthi TaxID=1436120 RepID=A0ABV9CIM8_9ACTN
MNAPRQAPFLGETTWARRFETPLREFLRTETGSAAVLLAATLAALAWANAHLPSYEALWGTTLSVRLGDLGISQDLRHWVNNGLMTLFFLVVGLEARREFDMGELRDRRRLLLPVAAGLGGMLVPIGAYLLVNAGEPLAHGWGAAMSTDTAFAMGMLALVASRFPARARTYILTVTVVDDLVALCVIAIFYSEHVRVPALMAAIAIFAVMLLVKYVIGVRKGLVVAVFGVAAWAALQASGVEPVVIGLAMGLLTYASPATRGDLERASDLFRLFREQPTAELARSASAGVAKAVSPNHRLQQLYHPWTSYVIVPLFALANAGIPIDGDFVARALTSPITLGIMAAYILGKPVGIVGATWLVTRLSRGRVRPPVGWAAVTGGGTIAGIGFTVSLLIATLAFSGPRLEEAKFGILAAALCASAVTWIISLLTSRLPSRVRARALLGTAESLIDLASPVDDDRDHLRGPRDAPVTVVEYGDFECPFCGLAEPVVRELLAGHGDVRYVWRHLPLHDVHPWAQLAAEASEAAASQGAFWEMHDVLLEHQGELRPRHLLGYAERIGLDLARFRRDLEGHAGAARIAEDVDSADLSGVSGTPTFFVNGRRHHGAYDITTLSAAVRAARARTALTS